MHHAFKLNDSEFNVELSRAREGYRLHLADRAIPVDLRRDAVGNYTLVVAGVREPIHLATRGDEVYVHLDGEAWQLSYEHPLERLAHQAHGGAEDGLRAPMPGSLVLVHARPGQAVARGQALLVMESMKMETTLSAARDGVVAAVHFAPGQTFDRDALLVSLEPSPPAPLPQAGEGRNAK